LLRHDLSTVTSSSSISSLTWPWLFSSSIPPSQLSWSAKIQRLLNLEIHAEKYLIAFASGLIPMFLIIVLRICFCSFGSVIKVGSVSLNIIFLLSRRILRKIECIVPRNGETLFVLCSILFIMSFAALFVKVVIRTWSGITPDSSNFR